MADLVSTLLWQPMGAEANAEITCDSVGTGIHDGGISAVARDLARFGRLLLEDGEVDGREVVPAAWTTHGPGPTPSGPRSPPRTTRRCCRAGGTATSSGSCRHLAGK